MVVLLGLKAPPTEEVVNSKEVASVQTLPEKEGVRVLIRTKGPVEVTVSRYKDPERLVLDLSLAQKATAPSAAEAQAPRPP